MLEHSANVEEFVSRMKNGEFDQHLAETISKLTMEELEQIADALRDRPNFTFSSGTNASHSFLRSPAFLSWLRLRVSAAKHNRN
jgi:hypothetical protein